MSLIDAENPKLKTLLNIIERDWDRIGVKNKNAGPHTLWPEAKAGKALLEECFPRSVRRNLRRGVERRWVCERTRVSKDAPSISCKKAKR